MVKLEQNELLIEITKKLSGTDPCWDKIATKFKDIPHDYRRKYNENNLASHLSETHARVSLENICKNYQDRIVFDPIKNGQRTENYLFEINCELKVKRLNNGEDYTDIDELLLIDGLPVIFEIKVGKYRYHVNSRKHPASPSSRGVAYAMNEQRIDYLIDPVKEFFGCNPGFVLVTTKDHIRKYNPTQNHFRELGGILVPLYTDRICYKKDVAWANSKYNLLES